MSARYVYFEDCSEADEEVSFEDIAACDSLAQLEEWAGGLDAVKADIHGQLEARRLSGASDDAWVYRVCKVLGFLSMGQRRIEQRMRKLGFEPNPFGKKIDELNRRVSTIRADAAFAKAFVEVAKEAMADFEFKDLADKAEARMAPQQEAA